MYHGLLGPHTSSNVIQLDWQCQNVISLDWQHQNVTPTGLTTSKYHPFGLNPSNWTNENKEWKVHHVPQARIPRNRTKEKKSTDLHHFGKRLDVNSQWTVRTARYKPLPHRFFLPPSRNITQWHTIPSLKIAVLQFFFAPSGTQVWKFHRVTMW